MCSLCTKWNKTASKAATSTKYLFSGFSLRQVGRVTTSKSFFWMEFCQNLRRQKKKWFYDVAQFTRISSWHQILEIFLWSSIILDHMDTDIGQQQLGKWLIVIRSKPHVLAKQKECDPPPLSYVKWREAQNVPIFSTRYLIQPISLVNLILSFKSFLPFH